MEIDPKQLKALQRLRKKYEDNETAYDALIYFLVTNGGKSSEDVSARIKEAVAFFREKDGQALYDQIVDVLEEKRDDIYDYSSSWAKAAKHKEGVMSLDPSVVSPEFLAMQALSKFKKNI